MRVRARERMKQDRPIQNMGVAAQYNLLVNLFRCLAQPIAKLGQSAFTIEIEITYIQNFALTISPTITPVAKSDNTDLVHIHSIAPIAYNLRGQRMLELPCSKLSLFRLGVAPITAL